MIQVWACIQIEIGSITYECILLNAEVLVAQSESLWPHELLFARILCP